MDDNQGKTPDYLNTRTNNMSADTTAELDKLLDEYYMPIKLPDINRNGLKAGLEALLLSKAKKLEKPDFNSPTQKLNYITVLAVTEDTIKALCKRGGE